jgi:hypothetical protein
MLREGEEPRPEDRLTPDEQIEYPFVLESRNILT